MRFEHPIFLWLLLLVIPALAGFFWWSWRIRQRLLTRFIAARLLPGLTTSVSLGRKKMKLALLGGAVVLLTVVLARPQLGFTWEEARSRGLDVIVAIDTSKSMLTSDLAPNRLRRAQLAALDLRKLAGADRLGLVAFAGSSFLQCPLSLDDEAFRQSVEILDTSIIPQGGTALSEAILAAQAAFKDKGDNHKVLIIFTDGEDHDGSAVETAKNAAKEGLRIFTIGVGTPDGEMIRLTDVQGRVDYLRDENGNAVKSRLDETLLRQVAEATGGFYMRLAGAQTMSQLYENGLARLPKSDLASQRVRRYHERYQWLLAAVLVLLLAEMFLPERKPARSNTATAGPAPAPALPPPAPLVAATAAAPLSAPASRPGSAAAPGIKIVLALLLAGSLGATTAEAGTGSRKGYSAYQKGKYVDAVVDYEAALQEAGDDPRLHFNVAAAAYQTGQYEKAHSHLVAAITTADVTLQQRAYYNLGNTQYRLGEAMPEFDSRQTQWEEAAKSLRNAVALQTNDVDAVYNLQFVERKLAELREWVRRREQAKRDAEAAQRRFDYAKALQIMETEKSRNPAAQTKDIDAYIQRLKQIDEIAPRQP
jgi:Ca-activated chloride channel family protein